MPTQEHIMSRFADKVVLVTGGTSGIGREAAKAFAREGAKVVITGRREKEGQAVVAEIKEQGGQASFARGDVGIEEEVIAILDHTIAAFGRLDVVFNNAGSEGRLGPIENATSSDFDEVFRTNVRGTWLVMKHALPHLRRSGGSIVNNSSVVADIGIAGTTIYSASKGAVHSLTRSAAIEFIKSGVRVNAVSPGPIETDMASRFFGSIENARGFAQTAVPAGVAGQASDIAEAVLYLASPAARFVVGQIQTVDGGLGVQ
jgi:NAD(P)-dependent dehydrogenase (short-subunit alcohol dehydrogenase family)